MRVVLIAVAAIFAGAGAARAQFGNGPIAVGVVRAEPTPIIETNQFIGRVQAINRVNLVARVTGFLEKRLFVEGSEVKRGDLLYQIEKGPFQADAEAKQAALAQATALLQNATLTLQRQQSLLNTPAGQRANYDNALAQQRSQGAQVLSAQANLQNSEINLGYTDIRAPIDGRITSTNVTEGNVVGPGTSGTLATIVSQDPMYVIFPISSRTVDDLRDRYAKAGGFNAVVVKVQLPGGKMYAQPGKLDYVAPTVSESTDTQIARAVLPNPTIAGMTPGQEGSRTLTDGQFVQVFVEGVTPIEVLGVPRAAILSDQQGDYVYTIGPGNTAVQTRVHLGQSTASTAAVLSGLHAGEEVIAEGIQKLQPGAKVLPGPASPGLQVAPTVTSGEP